MCDSVDRRIFWDHEIKIGDVLVVIVLWTNDTPDDWDVCVEVHRDGEMVDTMVWDQSLGDAWDVDQRRPPVPRMTRAQRSEYMAAIKLAKGLGNALWPTYADPPECDDDLIGEVYGTDV